MIDDDALLGLVADVVNEPPPARLMQAAYQSRSWADLDAELIELIDDSANASLAGARSDMTRRLVFEAPTGVIDIEFDADTRVLTGRLDPPSTVTIERTDGSTQNLSHDQQVSSFTASDLASGSIRLVLETPDHRWRTAWFTI